MIRRTKVERSVHRLRIIITSIAVALFAAASTTATTMGWGGGAAVPRFAAALASRRAPLAAARRRDGVWIAGGSCFGRRRALMSVRGQQQQQQGPLPVVSRRTCGSLLVSNNNNNDATITSRGGRSRLLLPQHPTNVINNSNHNNSVLHRQQRQFTRFLATTAASSNHKESEAAATVVRKLQPIAAAAPKKKQSRPARQQLQVELRRYRTAQAGPNNNRPPYTVFPNAVLDEICRSLPTTRQELLDVKGIGPKKLALYGDDILDLVAPYARGGGATVAAAVATGEDASAMPSANKGGQRGTRTTTIDAASLTREQREAAAIPLAAEPRRSVFITGSAGTGKSHVLRYIVQELRRRRDDSNNDNSNNNCTVAVCAPTGVAAVLVGGTTLHAHFGIGLGAGSVSGLVRKVRKKPDACQRMDETDVLVIDECSMLGSRLLETLDGVARECRHGGKFREKPFGGIQIVAFGDFFQLPPVHQRNSDEDWNWRPFAFESPVWSALGLDESFVELKQVVRHSGDAEFAQFLNKVRVGDISASDIQALNARCCISDRHPLPTDGIVPTRLYALNKDVDAENVSRLAALPGDAVVCEAVDKWREKMPPGTSAATKKRMKEALGQELPDEVSLKVGAQVMLTRNKDLDRGLVNGSRGVVERFVSAAGGRQLPIVRFDNGITTKVPLVEAVQYNPDGGDGCIVRLQVPLKLAWALTIHKSQGATLTRALLDVSRAFEFGQCYVALSRVQSLDGLWLEKPARRNNIMVSPQVLDYFRKART